MSRSDPNRDGVPSSKHESPKFASNYLKKMSLHRRSKEDTDMNSSSVAAFPEIKKIHYEGPKSDNPLAFRWYNADETVAGKTMRDHLRFTVCFWHTFRGTGGDPFGAATMLRPWDDGTESIENACHRVRVAFEFFEKLGVPFYAFHDRDVAPEGSELAETNANLDQVVAVMEQEQARTGVKLLWGTANLFSNPRFHAWSSHFLQRGGVCLCRGPGKEGIGGHSSVGRRELCFLGRSRGLPESLQHGLASGAGPPGKLFSHGG